MSKVAVVKGERSLDTVYRALDLIPYREALEPWDRALIKVNFITTKTWDTGATTDPIVVEALVNRVRDLGKEVLVVESDAHMTNADEAYTVSGIKDTLDRLGVEFLNMRHVSDKVEHPVNGGKTLKRLKVAKIATESAIISAAKLKTHVYTKVTLGMKNMFGMITTKRKARYHWRGMDKVVHDISLALPPALTVIDGFVAMEGAGPISGEPVEMNTIIASTDIVAADATAAAIMGFTPDEIDHIRWAHESRIGSKQDNEILGDGVDAVKRVFKRA
ncbi:DUF362 domain-containing protein [Candidatus Bathyarchaeota archaeon]|nr:DUF362 domain-containing protein [Candidatus Bathyarchaeota archaeon]